MKKELLIFGSNGALGKGVVSTLLKKDYDHYYFFDFSFDEQESLTGNNIDLIKIDDLSVEKNVTEAFAKITPSKDKKLFLFSTIGGFAGGNNVMDTPEDEIEKMFNMNFKSNFLISKYFANLVGKSLSGSLCLTSAYVALDPEKKKSAYGSSKGALSHLVKTLALEGEEINMSVNAIAPYMIDTPANRGWMKDADYNSWQKPEEIGELLHFLFSNHHFISGNVIGLKQRFDP